MITLGPYVSYKKHDLIIQLGLVLVLAYEISGSPAFRAGDRLTNMAIIAIFLALFAVFAGTALMRALYELAERTSPRLAADVLMAGAAIYMGFIALNGAGDWRSLFTWIAWYGAGRGAFEVYGRVHKWWHEARHRGSNKNKDE